MIALFAGHRTAANILMIAIAGLGLMAMPALQRDTFPVTPPSDVSVRITYPGATSAEVETGICTVADPLLTKVENLAKLTCLARENAAQITAEMVEGADMTRFYNDIKDTVDGLNSFPAKADAPVSTIVERTASVSSVAVAGPSDPAVLYEYAQQLADRLRADPAISLVEVNGFSDREIAIEFSQSALERYGLTMTAVGAALSRYSLDMPAGTLEGRAGDTAIRFPGEKRTPSELAQIPLSGSAAGGEVRLGDVATIRAGFDGVRDVTFDLQPGKPELVVRMKPAAANLLGVTPSALATELRAAFRGDSAVSFADAHGQVDVVARLAATERRTIGDVLALRVPGKNGALVPLSAVATVTETRGYNTITHVDGQRAVSVQGTINPAVANARELMAAMRAEYLPELAKKRPDVKVKVLGVEQDTATTGASLMRFMIAGAMGVYLLLAFYMSSFIRPLAVIAAVPLSIIGVMWGHMALGLQISLPSLVGLATLAGVVVNHSILLDAFIGERRASGAPMLEAGKEAVRDRFRAIFLTSLTTVVGLGPLLFEQSTQAQFLRPIVASLAFGLTSATLLSLFVPPAILAILEDFGVRVANTGEAEDGETAPAPETA